MLTIQNLTYIHSNKCLLFSNLNLTVNTGDKIALIGNNGTGKSTLFKLIAGLLEPSDGVLNVEAIPYYIPQLFGQFNSLTIAEALGVDEKRNALREILNGNVSEENYELLNDDWTIEDRCSTALQSWQLDGLDLSQKMETLSGGQKTKVFLAGISIHQPEFILMDEPSNHLDHSARQLLYEFIQHSKSTIFIISHDRKLLSLIDTICELSPQGIRTYGGNYEFYTAQKQIEENALSQDIQSKERALRKAKEKEREILERQQKLDSRGKGKQEKSGVSRIMMNTLRNQAENSTAKLKGVHSEKIGNIRQELQHLRVSEIDQMKFGFDHSKLHKGKNLFIARDMNFSYGNEKYLWKENLDISLVSGERISVYGSNGSGKTTLINVILGNLKPQTGTVFIAETKSVYIDQDYSLIADHLSVYEQAQHFNTSALQEHELKTRLNRFLFPKDDWDKPNGALSGGEKMRLMLCCLNIGNQSPDLIILDEPTNNLDIQNIAILTNALNDYQGTLVVISHDETFLEAIHIERRFGVAK